MKNLANENLFQRSKKATKTGQKRSAYPIRTECLPNPNGVPTPFWQINDPFSAPKGSKAERIKIDRHRQRQTDTDRCGQRRTKAEKPQTAFFTFASVLGKKFIV